MSLDIYFIGKVKTGSKTCPHCLKEIEEYEEQELHWQNITHNLSKMADAAGIGDVLWRDTNLNGTVQAKELIEPLEKGLADMKARPEYYKQFNASNGWGLYEHFVPWVEKLIIEAKNYPEVLIHVSR